MTAIEALLRRDRAVVAIGLAALCLLAWVYVWRGAGMGMTAVQMTKATLFPHTQPAMTTGMAMPSATFLTATLMWWVMMIAMMLPSAAPLALLHVRALRQTGGGSRDRIFTPTVALISGYVLAWLIFSVVAAGLQHLLVDRGLISTMMLWSESALLSASVLVAAGVYQLSPLKQTCLKHCRNPTEFLTRYRPAAGIPSFFMGMHHGIWCISCCWMLMLLLFVGGVMNLAWIAALALLVLAEKITSRGRLVSRICGGILIAWGVATLTIAR